MTDTHITLASILPIIKVKIILTTSFDTFQRQSQHHVQIQRHVINRPQEPLHQYLHNRDKAVHHYSCGRTKADNANTARESREPCTLFEQ